MRITLVLDSDLARLVEEAMHRERRPMKHVINNALRRGLGHLTIATSEPYRVVPHESALLPGLDPTGFNRLADELVDEAIIAKARRIS